MERRCVRFMPAALVMVALATWATPAFVSEQSTVPNFELKDVEGKPFDLASHLTGGPVLIDFWATWCKPCLRELPHLDDLQKKFGDRGLTVVAISTDESRSMTKVKSYASVHGYGFHVLLDPNQEVFRKLGGKAMPYMVLVSPDHTSLYLHTGYRDGDEKLLEARLTEVMADYGKGKSSDETHAAAGDSTGH